MELYSPERTNLGQYSHRIHEVHFDDPFSTKDGGVFNNINGKILPELVSIGSAYYNNYGAVDLNRLRNGKFDLNNPATLWLIENLPTFAEWWGTVPTAAALDPLYDPSEGKTLPDGTPLSGELLEWFRNIADGRGLRSRAAVVGEVLEAESLRLQREGVHDQPEWLSLASGAAQPVIGAAGELAVEYGITPRMTLVDMDQSALGMARGYAAKASVSTSLETIRMNVLRMDDSRLNPNGYNLVDAVGLVEYLKEEDDSSFAYSQVVKNSKNMASASMFIENAYSLVRPGGSLVIGNMLDTHPQLGFTLNVIQWPHIQPRSIEKMLEIFEKASILEGSPEVDIYCPDDGVYAIYNVRKPE